MGAEDQSVTVPARSLVRYGASPYERYVERIVTGSFIATNAFFGSDPAPYADKFIYLSALPPPPGGPAALVETWTPLGIEPQTVSVPPNSTVRYGVTPFDRYIEIKATGTLKLGSTSFGPDPAPGSYKRLFLQGSAAVPTPAQYSAPLLPPPESLRYGVVELGIEPDAYAVDAKSIGRGGEVVGNAVVPGSRGLGTTRAFLWRPGDGYFPLANAYVGSQAKKVDAQLRIVGINGTGTSFGAAIWEGNGQPTPLPQRYVGLATTYPEDANSNGLVVGWTVSPYSSYREPFFWSKAGGMGYIGALPSLPNCMASAVNDQAQVVGVCWDFANSSIQSAFIWDPVTRMRDLGASLGLPNTAALKINAAGVVVGRYTGGHFLWDPRAVGAGSTGVTLLPQMFTPHAIDDTGRIWGQAYADGRMSASVWANGVLHNLNALIDPFDPTRARLYFINALGIDGDGRILVTHGSQGDTYTYRAATLVPIR